MGIIWVWAIAALLFWWAWMVSPKSAISKDNLYLAQGVTWMGWLLGLYYAIPLVILKTLMDLWKLLRAKRREQISVEQNKD